MEGVWGVAEASGSARSGRSQERPRGFGHRRVVQQGLCWVYAQGWPALPGLRSGRETPAAWLMAASPSGATELVGWERALVAWVQGRLWGPHSPR